MQDFFVWNELKIKTNDLVANVRIREGEIRWCRLGLNIGNEILGKGKNFLRPVLVFKKYSSDVFLGIPLTTKQHSGSWYYNFEHEDKSGTMILNQARLLDRKRLENKLFEISEKELLKIKKAYCDLILS